MKYLVVSLLLISGCATTNKVYIHPIEKSDIFSIPKGTQVGEIKAEKDGWFLSDDYVKMVMKAKISK